MYYKGAGYSSQKTSGGSLFMQLRYRNYCLQITMLVLLACLVAVYFLLGSLADPQSKAEGTVEPDALDKYLNQQIQFLGAGGQKSNMMDPTAKENETLSKLTNQMTYTSDRKCRLSKERVNEHACQQEIVICFTVFILILCPDLYCCEARHDIKKAQLSNMMDPTAKENETLSKLTNQMTYTSDRKCRLSKERVNEHACQQEISNMMDPTAKENETLSKLTNQMTYTSDRKCRLSKERVNEHACQQEIKDITGYQDILGMKVYTKLTQCGSGSKSIGRPWLLFLHGQHYHTRTWVEINMLRLTTKLGYNNLAIDLPGFGASNASKLSPSVTHVQFLDEVLKHMGIGDEKFVLVSPSMSGEYSIPYIKAKAKVADSKMVGFVAAAPVAVDQLKDFNTSTIKVRTLVIYGERDDNLGVKSAEVLSKLPNATVFKVPNAGHPSYLDNSEVFMREMFKFLLCDITPPPPK
ncbi:uncharacterized protein LOC142345008 [Convolutriloba macropyga]|uniref:uncharacterized protein LOC142345008 n=1 Tax=Convolutriloba macropyga TaxID=536237 RepID=UPI003F520606